MSNKTFSLEEITEDYKVFIDSCGKYNFFTRSLQDQKEKSEECIDYILLIKLYKKQAIKNNLENDANNLFHMQCMLNAMRSSLKMWIKVKESKFEDAWSLLIDAQDYTEVALKVSDYEGVRKLEERLKNIENSIFPNWPIYNSPGYTETIGKCSICHKNFALCDHIENQIYFGAFCQRIDRKIIRADHVAFVQNPKDKRCIITKITNNDGKIIDYFTWLECKDQSLSLNNDNDEMRVTGIIMSLHSLDLS